MASLADSAIHSMEDLPSALNAKKPREPRPRRRTSDKSTASTRTESVTGSDTGSVPPSQLKADANGKPETPAAAKPEKDHGPYVDVLVRRQRALKKRVERIEAYEHKPVDALNPDQKESLAQLPGLRHTLRDLDDLIKAQQTIAADEARAAKRAARLADKEQAAARRAAADEARNTVLAQFHAYITLVRELVTLDQDDPVVMQVRNVFLGESTEAVVDAMVKVCAKSDEEVAGIDGEMTYEQIHHRLIEAPLRIEDLLAPVEFLVDEDAVVDETSAVPAETEEALLDETTPAETDAAAAQVSNETNEPAETEPAEPLAPAMLTFMSGEDFVNTVTVATSKLEQAAELLSQHPLEATEAAAPSPTDASAPAAGDAATSKERAPRRERSHRDRRGKGGQVQYQGERDPRPTNTNVNGTPRGDRPPRSGPRSYRGPRHGNNAGDRAAAAPAPARATA
ncbi:hypothetical protein AMAG_08135 [Allomyces macrogynus ATCC 38327]|uniref:Uncharacterized protein n=1 Tax=Allomyces macrogynus (strain ATCC 38327) TaxID=578462 RepID=A0A0L0SKE0_ALLM3|nr:hypothetical protein AMAG_08135 [Allomyces macrogynus ATCC 38327]|eukprot:KNE62962.1 hypothetical protein AMAG_08135 [Allomyces macrogynus ATCC 38327]